MGLGLMVIEWKLYSVTLKISGHLTQLHWSQVNSTCSYKESSGAKMELYIVNMCKLNFESSWILDVKHDQTECKLVIKKEQINPLLRLKKSWSLSKGF